MAATEGNKGSLSKRVLKLNKPVLSLDHPATSRTPKSGQTSFLSRFQTRFLPHAASPSPLGSSDIRVETPVGPPPPKYLKIRIISWNMNESLPKGDLAALLGTVPPYQVDATNSIDLNIPGLALDTNHPYHLVLVAGQECPTLMGLPLGIGGGMKWDRDDDDKRKDKKVRDDDKKSKEKVDQYGTPEPSSTPMGARTPSRGQHPHHSTGWSAILEDYFSRGIGSIPGAKPEVPLSSVNTSLSSLVAPAARRTSPNAQNMGNKDAQWKLPAAETDVPKTGPYELLTKERLMGIYLALYVHRDCRPLVENFSQSSVTAGLIGGRLGNKGAVAISLKFDGTTYLFLNAHLAAHEEKMALRVANMIKIKAELAIDNFLPPNDERKKATDLTDRFDHTFLFGDLNFRLDITRRHAEWLIMNKKYAEAQEFDQLQKIMKGLGTHVFDGFSEFPIDFAPTFKYDVLRTLKGSKGSKRGALTRRVLSEVEEQERDHLDQSSPPSHDQRSQAGGELDAESIQSRETFRRSSSSSSDSDADEDNDQDRSLVELAKTASVKAKKKWFLAFKSAPSLPATPTTPTKAFHDDASTSVSRASSKAKKLVASPARTSTIVPPVQMARATTSMDVPRVPWDNASSPTPELVRSTTTKSASQSKTTFKDDGDDQEAVDIEDKGVYDTSSKKRVPSWCDRILVKTTVQIPDTPIQEVPTPTEELHGDGRMHTRKITPMESLFQVFKPKPRSGSTTTSTTISHYSSGRTVGLNSRLGSKTMSVGGTSSKKSSAGQSNGTTNPLRIATTLDHRPTDSPTAISKSSSSPASGGLPVPVATDLSSLRRTTSPNVGRVGSAGSTGTGNSLRIQTRRRRSLSATLPRSSEPVGLPARTIPASASVPPPHEYTEPAGGQEITSTSKDTGGGARKGLRKILSLVSTSFTGVASPPATATPDTGQIILVDDQPLPPRVYKKGEVQCLEYGTLSDRQMRQLEGRSDHRPIIGHFAIYL